MKKHIILLQLCCMIFLFANAQTSKPVIAPVFFADETAPEYRQRAETRAYTPEKAAVYQLDFNALKQSVRLAPWEFTVEAQRSNTQIVVPDSKGNLETFKIWETAIMHPDLAAKFPEIRTYAGAALSDPGKSIRITISPDRGFNATITRPDMGMEYVQPLVWGATDRYVVFDKADLPSDPGTNLQRLNLTGLDRELAKPYTMPAESRGTLAAPVRLKVYRFAASCTGEFSLDHGGTLASTLAALVEYTNRIDIAFERDIDLRLQLFSEQEKLIFTDPGADPFNGTTAAEYMEQNLFVVTNYVGINNFDVGHVYARYPGGPAAGIAGGQACTANKARAISTGTGNGNYGDRFVEIIGQEIGHQFAGGHTWNKCEETGGRSSTEAFEPGSGTTIMAYAGVCGTDNVGGGDTYYHAGSIHEIRGFNLQTGPTCGSWIQTNNNPPVVDFNYTDGFFIPISNPFELKGIGTDADGDPMTYCWEEMDLGPICPLLSPVGSAPIYRSFPAVTANNRVFPRMSSVLAGINTTIGEHTPTYTRDLTFRLTARDNRTGGGGVGWKDVEFKAYEGAGPFEVITPNSIATVWRVGEYAKVSWSVNNTNKAPVNCDKVNIMISINAGNTYTTLLENTPNDGLEYVVVPNTPGTAVRIRINASNNVFFDVSNRNFRIEAPVKPNLSLSASQEQAVLCLPANFTTNIVALGSLGLSGTANLDLTGTVPPGAVTKFSSNTLAISSGSSRLDVDLSKVVAKGTFTFNIRAIIPGVDTAIIPLSIRTINSDFSGVTPVSPADGSTGVSLNQTVRWKLSPFVDAYDVQVATSPAFRPADIIAVRSGLTVDSFKVPVFLTKGTPYYWRVRANNECSSQWLDPSFFSTFSESCSMAMANDLPKNISSSSAPTVESMISVNASGTIGTLNVKLIKGSHQFFRDLEFKLVGPDNTEVVLIKNKCGNFNGNFSFGLSDLAPNPFACPPTNTGQIYRAENPLAPFRGKNVSGIWKLVVKDGTIGSGGSLQDFQLEFCSSVSLNPPVLVKNEPLKVNPGENKPISADLLLSTDANNTAAQITYILVTLPRNGRLEKNGVVLALGDRFTQADIDAGVVRYFDTGSGKATDYFKFVVTDGEGGFVATPRFVIDATVGSNEPTDLSDAFKVFPNPSNGLIWIDFGRPLDAEMRVSLLNTSGQLLQSSVLAAGTDRRSLDLSGLPTGMYWIRIDNKTGAGTQRVVKM